MPDIQLLPELSVALGSSIDALFSLTDDSRIERIDNMLWDRRFLTQQEFESEERFLKEKCLEPERQSRATLLLAELRGNYGEAIGWYEKVIEIARTEWNEEEGELVAAPRRNIARLREKLA